jgi:hypothetical protein
MFQEPRLAATTGLKLPKQLVRLIDTFLRVDKKIALTMTLKTAAIWPTQPGKRATTRWRRASRRQRWPKTTAK